jgi:hypothetical protein
MFIFLFLFSIFLFFCFFVLLFYLPQAKSVCRNNLKIVWVKWGKKKEGKKKNLEGKLISGKELINWTFVQGK